MTRSAESWQFTVSGAEGRLDQFLAAQDLGLTRSRLHALIEEGQVRLNGSWAKPAQRLRAGDLVSLTVPPPRELDLVPQDIPISLVYQDDQLIVLDKPAGLSVHPGPGHPDGTLVNALLARCPDIRGIGGAIRPGIVHRLDKDTSGLMMVAKTDQAHQSLSQQIKDRQVTKGYLAVATRFLMPSHGIIEAPIGRDPRNRKRMAMVTSGRAARTSYRVMSSYLIKSHEACQLVELYLESGRTHQIRVHLAHLGHPLLGDRLYGRSSPLVNRHFLHAHHLGFAHPRSGEPVEFRCDLPQDLQQALQILELKGTEQEGLEQKTRRAANPCFGSSLESWSRLRVTHSESGHGLAQFPPGPGSPGPYNKMA